jgi:hypothetical protein
MSTAIIGLGRDGALIVNCVRPMISCDTKK